MDFSWRSVVSTNTMVWHFDAFLDINLAVNLQEDFGSQIIHTLLPSGRRGEETHAPRKCQESGWASGFPVIGALFCHQVYWRGLSQIDRICMCSLRHETSVDYRPWHYLNAITSMPLGQRGRTYWRGAQTLGGWSMFQSHAFCVRCQFVSHSCNSFQVDIFMRLLYKW